MNQLLVMMIKQSLDNVMLSEASIKQSKQATTFGSIKPSIKLGTQNVLIDGTVLPFDSINAEKQ